MDEGSSILDTWDSYVVKPAMLPTYIPLRVATQVLFIGKAMLLIRGQRATTDAGKGRKRPPLRPTEDDYAALTHALGALPEAVCGVFDAGRVERIVEDTHGAVAQALWVVLNREVDLVAIVKVRACHPAKACDAHPRFRPVPTTVAERRYTMRHPRSHESRRPHHADGARLLSSWPRRTVHRVHRRYTAAAVASANRLFYLR